MKKSYIQPLCYLEETVVQDCMLLTVSGVEQGGLLKNEVADGDDNFYTKEDASDSWDW